MFIFLCYITKERQYNNTNTNTNTNTKYSNDKEIEREDDIR